MGILSLFFAVLFTSNLVDPRLTYAALAVAVIVILAVGYGAVNGFLHRDLDVGAYVTSWNGWLVAAIQFALFLLVILTVFHTLYDQLIRMFVGAEQRARELEESRARLDAEVSQRQELEAQFIQAQKMEAVGRLAGGVAHDFNNHLFVITSMTEALGRKMGPDSPHHRGLEVILQSARRSAELTRQLLTFSRKQGVVFISGYSDDVVSSHGVLQDGAHFLQKPFDYVALGRTVREALATRPGPPTSAG